VKNIFFPFLNWILKIDSKKPEIPKNISYMTNRWLSMTSKPIAQIVNMTTNKWNISDEEFLAKFYYKVIPKHTKKIQYIKKSNKGVEESDPNLDNLCSVMEISRKELEMYNNTLEELNLLPK